MDKRFPVYLENRQVGDVSLQKNGLYYNFFCKCTLPEKAFYRLYAECGDWRVKIGTLVPEGEVHTLRVNIAAGKLKCNDIHFLILPEGEKVLKNVIPVCEDKPFSHIDNLESAVFAYCDGRTCLTFSTEGDYSLSDT